MAEMSKIGEIELLKPLAVGTMAWGRTWLDEKLNRGWGELLILSVYIYIYTTIYVCVYRDITYIYICIYIYIIELAMMTELPFLGIFLMPS
jgi:hypothetical protein